MLEKQLKRQKRKARISANLAWTQKPRLSVYRSNVFIYAQIIDLDWKVLCSSSDIKTKWKLNKTESSKKVWEEIAKKALDAKITDVVFDRNWFAYHGRVKALAAAARETWLKF